MATAPRALNNLMMEQKEKDRYLSKIQSFEKDPYLLNYNENVLPMNVSTVEIYEYLVHGKSYYTRNEFSAYKSLNSYKLYEGGWVQYMAGHKLTCGFLVFGKVCELR